MLPLWDAVCSWCRWASVFSFHYSFFSDLWITQKAFKNFQAEGVLCVVCLLLISNASWSPRSRLDFEDSLVLLLSVPVCWDLSVAAWGQFSETLHVQLSGAGFHLHPWRSEFFELPESLEEVRWHVPCACGLAGLPFCCAQLKAVNKVSPEHFILLVNGSFHHYTLTAHFPNNASFFNICSYCHIVTPPFLCALYFLTDLFTSVYFQPFCDAIFYTRSVPHILMAN